MTKLYTPLTDDTVSQLRAGQEVELSGYIYTARDAAHQRLIQEIKKAHHNKLPINLKGAVIYYTGPTPPPPQHIIGSAGPTSAYRMDPYTPTLLSLGLKATIGKGSRSKKIVAAQRQFRAVYFTTIAGAGALLSQFIKDAKIVAYPQLGPAEAIYQLLVEDLYLIVVNDIYGNDFYEQQIARYKSKSI